MSFDDLFTLLLFIVFIGLPLLNRMQQRGGGTRPGAPPPGRGQRPGGPARPPAPEAGPASPSAEARRRDEADARPAPAPERDDDPFAELARRLEEARTRVREASQGTSGQASASTSSTAASSSASARASEPRRTIATPAPPSAAIPDPRAGAAPRPRADRDPFPKARPRPDAPWRAQRGSVPRNALTEEAPALEVQRGRTLTGGSDRRAREVARLRAQELVALDAQSFRKGIMWHMVLTGPVAHRNRRKPSLPASR